MSYNASKPNAVRQIWAKQDLFEQMISLHRKQMQTNNS